ncbi:UPF0481 protein At3g47200 [Linum grandiflorum]
MEPDDPVFNVSWMLSFIMRDLLRLENQVPIFVLKSLYEIAILDGSVKEVPSLTELALRFFDHGFERPEEVLEKYKDVGGKHLLDLFRRTFIPKGREESQRQNNGFLHLPQSVRKAVLCALLEPRHDLHRIRGVVDQQRGGRGVSIESEDSRELLGDGRGSDDVV